MVKPFEDAAFSLKPAKRARSSKPISASTSSASPRSSRPRPSRSTRCAPRSRRICARSRRRSDIAEAADQFTNLVYEQSDSLQPAADKLGLKVADADDLTRARDAGCTQDQPQVFTPRVIEALFCGRLAEEPAQHAGHRDGTEYAGGGARASTIGRPRCARSTRSRRRSGSASSVRKRLSSRARPAKSASQNSLKQPTDTGFSPPYDGLASHASGIAAETC